MDLIPKEQHVTLRAVYSLCRSFDTLLEAGLGPNGKSILLSTPTGHVLITKVSCTLLRSLNVGHPVGRMIVKSVVTHHNYSGDGGKTFILYLTSVFGNIENTSSFQESESRNSLCYAVHYIRRRLFFDILLPAVRRNCCIMDIGESKVTTVSVMLKMVKSHLCGKYTETMRRHLSHVLVDFLCSGLSDFQKLYAEVTLCIDYFNLLCIEVDCLLPLSSYVCEGIVIQRDILDCSHSQAKVGHTRFILVHDLLTNKSELTSVFEAKDQFLLSSTFLWKSQCSTALVEWMLENNVNVMFSACVIDDMLKNLCSKAGILMVQSVEKEDFDRLELLFHITAIHFMSDLGEVKSCDFIGCSESCELKVFGRKRFVCLKLCEQNCGNIQQRYQYTARDHIDNFREVTKPCAYSSCLNRQLVVCGMSAGACQQIRLDLLHALKTLRLWLDNKWLDCEAPFCKAVHIVGGGTFELACFEALQEFMKHKATQLSESLTVCCKAVCAALQAVPLRLLNNSFRPKLASKIYINESIKSSTTRGINTLGYNGHSGLQLQTDTDVIEPLTSKILVFDHVLELTEQLLRLNSVIHVKKLVSICQSDSDDETVTG